MPITFGLMIDVHLFVITIFDQHCFLHLHYWSQRLNFVSGAGESTKIVSKNHNVSVSNIIDYSFNHMVFRNDPEQF